MEIDLQKDVECDFVMAQDAPGTQQKPVLHVMDKDKSDNKKNGICIICNS